MSYIINLTDGTVLTTIKDGTTNKDTGLTLIGRNYVSYGDAQNENFVKLLENFSDTVPPTLSSLALQPLKGTLWFDSGSLVMKVYDGVNWVPVSQQTSGNTAPLAPLVGDQWYDTGNQQLFVWTGSLWELIGPSASVLQGKTGVYVESVTDSAGGTRTVVNTYKDSNLISVASSDAETFIPTGTTYARFASIEPGINLSNVSVLNGVATNSQLAGGILPSLFARIDQSNVFDGNIKVSGNLSIGSTGSANIYQTSSSLVLQNSQVASNVEVVVNTTTGSVTALHVEGTSGRISVLNPTGNTHIANKGYVDAVVSGSGGFFNDELARIESELSAQYIDYNAKILQSSISDAANLLAQTTRIDNTVGDLSSNVNARFAYANVSLINHDEDIAAINNYLTFVANIANPTFTGVPNAPTPDANDSSTKIATTEYVTAAGQRITTAWQAGVAAEASRTNAAIANAVAPKAEINNPTFTGTVRAPTPVTGDNSTQVATTAFVNGIVSSQKFNYTVSTANPSGGNNGDFWFKIG